MNTLKALVRQECDYPVEENVLDMFLGSCEVIAARSGECIVEAGEYSPYIYVVKTGIIRLSDYDGDKERTFAFGLPGTIFVLKYSFVKGLPTYFSVYSCCDSVLLRLSKKDFDMMMKRSHEFAIWMFHCMMEELYFQEKKNSTVFNGLAKERFKALWIQRPEIIMKVSQNI